MQRKELILSLLGAALVLVGCACKTSKKNSDTIRKDFAETQRQAPEKVFFASQVNLLDSLCEVRFSEQTQYAYYDVDGDGTLELFFRLGEDMDAVAYHEGKPELIASGDFKLNMVIRGNYICVSGSCGSGCYYHSVSEIKDSRVANHGFGTEIYSEFDSENEGDKKTLDALDARSRAYGVLYASDLLSWKPFVDFVHDTDVERYEEHPIQFGYSDETCSRFLIPEMDSVTLAQKYCFMICERGLAQVEYEVVRTGDNSKDNGRNNSGNFGHDWGAVYRTINDYLEYPQGDEESDEPRKQSLWSCMFVCRDFLCNHYWLETKKSLDKEDAYGRPKPIVQNHPWVKMLENRFKRKLNAAYPVCVFGVQDKYQFVSASFEVKNGQALGVYALFTDMGGGRYQMSAIEFPADYDDCSTWYVDDGGEFFPPEILGAFIDRKGELILVTTAWGVESISFTCYKTNGDKLVEFKELGEADFYIVPLRLR